MNITGGAGPKVAYVFEGGGSLAASQIGMLRALTESRPRPQLVIGASAGAINAVAFAADPTLKGVALLEALWLSIRRRDIVRLSRPDVGGRMTRHRGTSVADAGLRALLQRHFAERRLEDGQLPAHVVTTDLASGAAHVVSSGPVVEALLASAAIPGVFPSVSIGGRRLVDGGVAANTPVRQAQDLGATHIYVLPAAAPAGPGDRMLQTALEAISHGLDQEIPIHSARVHRLPPAVSPTGNILDFRHGSYLIAESYRLTRQWLTRLQPVNTTAA
jgi:NTE family protein